MVGLIPTMLFAAEGLMMLPEVWCSYRQQKPSHYFHSCEQRPERAGDRAPDRKLTSVPSASTHNPVSTPTPLPLLDPPGFCASWYAPTVWPPRALHPLSLGSLRKLAHSEGFEVPRITAPASRSLVTAGLSRAGLHPSSSREPEVASMGSWVAMLSLTRTGTPWRGLAGAYCQVVDSHCGLAWG